jgi:hypothetical protein
MTPCLQEEIRMKNALLTLALILTGSFAGPALADSGTPEEQAACRPDVRKFCHHIHEDAGDMVFLACLQEHRPKLSLKCRTLLESHGQ